MVPISKARMIIFAWLNGSHVTSKAKVFATARQLANRSASLPDKHNSLHIDLYDIQMDQKGGLDAKTIYIHHR